MYYKVPPADRMQGSAASGEKLNTLRTARQSCFRFGIDLTCACGGTGSTCLWYQTGPAHHVVQGSFRVLDQTCAQGFTGLFLWYQTRPAHVALLGSFCGIRPNLGTWLYWALFVVLDQTCACGNTGLILWGQTKPGDVALMGSFVVLDQTCAQVAILGSFCCFRSALPAGLKSYAVCPLICTAFTSTESTELKQYHFD